jgi:hypothetical protein
MKMIRIAFVEWEIWGEIALCVKKKDLTTYGVLVFSVAPWACNDAMVGEANLFNN